MLDEKRTSVIYVRIRPSVRAILEAERAAKGQSLTEYLERTILRSAEPPPELETSSTQAA